MPESKVQCKYGESTPEAITHEKFREDMKLAYKLRLRVNRWEGTDREGNFLSVVWVAGPALGYVMAAYWRTVNES